jgi:hypothetical protein
MEQHKGVVELFLCGGIIGYPGTNPGDAFSFWMLEFVSCKIRLRLEGMAMNAN